MCVHKLHDAKFCLDCEVIFGRDSKTCPTCGGTSWVWLSTFLPSVNFDYRGVHPRMKEDSYGQQLQCSN